MHRFPKYQQNLGYRNVPVPGATEWRVYSYNRHVATKRGDTLVELGYWSVTTRKHVNYAAQQLQLTVKHFAK